MRGALVLVSQIDVPFLMSWLIDHSCPGATWERDGNNIVVRWREYSCTFPFYWITDLHYAKIDNALKRLASNEP